MDVQIAKLNEGMKQAAKAEETIGRIDKLAADTALRMEAAAKLEPGSPARDDQAAEGFDRAPRVARGPKSARWR